MDHAKIGRSIRIVRIRRRIRQSDLAALVELSQPTISRIEGGRLDGITVGALERVLAELGIGMRTHLWWQGAELDRLIAGRHSAMHDAVARLFEDLPAWLAAPEVTFAVFGERGVIDILAWHAQSRSLLVIELKTELIDVQETVGTLHRKQRLAVKIAEERGWRPATVSAWLVIADGRTNRRRVHEHRAMLRAAFPVDGRTVNGWLASPHGSIAALSFLPSIHGANAGRQFTPVRRVNRRRPSVEGGR